MANRNNTFLLKRSNVAGKVPAAGDLRLGELAINTADGILYASGTTANSILPIGWDRVARTGDTMTGSLYAPSISATTISATTYLNLPSSTFTGGTVTGPTNFTNGLTANTIHTDYIDLNTNYTGATTQGRLSWDSGTGTLNIGVGDVGGTLIDLQVGQEEVVRVFNAEGTSLLKGEIVYVFGSQGNRPSVKRAIATGDGYSVTTLGMVDVDIPSGSQGYVTTFGMINNLNTVGLTGGTAIWLSPTVAGGYTEVKPKAPYHTVLLGYVVRVSATVGSLFINISNGWEIDELHDVRLNGREVGDLLTYSAYNGSNVWVNSKTLNGSYTITGNTTIGGQMKATSVSATTISTPSFTANNGGITATTVSATTYYNLPKSIPYSNNKSHVTSATTVGDNFNTGVRLSGSPIANSYVGVTINGINVEVGNGVITKDCYFSSNGTSGGVINFSGITTGDYFMWNTTISEYDLDSTDIISFYYNILI